MNLNFKNMKLFNQNGPLESRIKGFLLPLNFVLMIMVSTIFIPSNLSAKDSLGIVKSPLEELTIRMDSDIDDLAFLGVITYQWQSNTKGCDSTFVNIPGATSAIYNPPAGLMVTTYYRRITYSTLNSVECSALSNCVKVTVNDVNPGSISAPSPVVCLTSGNILLSSTALGTTTMGGVISYRWETNTTGCGNTFTPIPSSNSPSLTVNPVAGQTNYYRRVTISTLSGVSCEKVSNCVVVDKPSANLSCSIVQTQPVLCIGGSTGIATATVNGGFSPYTYSWSDNPARNSNVATGLSAGSYTMTVTDAKGCTSTCSVTITTAPNATIGNFVWNDTDYDGIQEMGEPGIGGVSVTAYYNATNTLAASTTTNGSGIYSLSLCQDTYYLEFGTVSNMRPTLPNTTTPNLDSDINPGTRRTPVFTLSPGQNIDSLDAGYTSVIDVSLDKSVNNLRPNQNDSVTYTIVVMNALTMDTAKSVFAQDLIPIGLTNIRSITGGATISGSTITWNIGTLAPGQSKTMSYIATVLPPNTTRSYRNVAQVTAHIGKDFDSNPASLLPGQTPVEDDEDTVDLKVLVVDVSLDKSVSNLRPNQNDVVTYTIVANNAAGRDTAHNVFIQDIIPTGLTNITGITGGATLSGSTITWNVGTLAPGQNKTMTYMATVLPPNTTRSYRNVAQVTAQTEKDFDSNPASLLPGQTPVEDDEDTVDLKVLVVDVSLDKSVSNLRPNQNDIVTYTIVANNAAGRDTAHNVFIQDIIPTGLTNITGITGGATLSGTTITWNVGTLAPGQNKTMTYMATVLPPNTTRSYRNVAQVTAQTEKDFDSNPASLLPGQTPVEDDEDTVDLKPLVVDVSLDKSVSNLRPNPTDVVTYTIVASNAAGRDTAHNVSIQDLLPNGLTNITNITGGASISGNLITWNAGTIAPGGNKTMTYQATVLLPNTTRSYRNLAQVVSQTEKDFDSTPSSLLPGQDPSEDDEDTVILRPLVVDVSLDKSVSNLRPNQNDVVTYTIVASNAAGRDTAHNVFIQDIIPTGLTNIAGITGGATLSGTTITWNVGTLAPGQNKTMTYMATVLPPNTTRSYRNVAQVTAQTEKDFDSNPASLLPGQTPVEDDEDTVDLKPLVVDVSLDKSVSNLRPNPTDVVTYTIVASNAAGRDTAHNVSIQDLLPNGLTNITNITGGASISGNLITWNAGTIAPGGNKTMTYQATVLLPNTTRSYRNLAQVVSQTEKDFDSNPASLLPGQDPIEDDEDTVILRPIVVDVSLDKSVNNLRPNPSSVVTYTLVASNAAGRDMATNVIVQDVVPNGLSNIGNFTGGGSLSGNLITWNVGSLAPGQIKTLTYQATVLIPSTTRSYRNIAQVVSQTEKDIDSNPGSLLIGQSPIEDDEDSVDLKPILVDLSLTKSVSELRPSANDSVTYTIIVSNATGRDTAHNVSSIDILPNGVAIGISSLNPSQGTAIFSGGNFDGPDKVGGNITWTIGAIAPGASKVLTYKVKVLAVNTTRTYRNVAQVVSQTEVDFDSNPGSLLGPQTPVEDDEAQVILDPLTGVNVTWYQDLDNDNFGNSAVTTQSPTKPVGYVAVGGDCNDNNNTVYPGAPELCDGIDNDCDNLVDGLDPSFAPDLVVTNTNDSGDGSLRKAIECARPNDVITFGPAVQNATINLTSTKLLINKNLTIKNTGAGIVYISGVAIPTVFDIVVGNTLSLENLRILSNASATPVIENYGTLNVTDIQLISPVTTYPKVLNKGMMMIWGSYSMKKQ